MSSATPTRPWTWREKWLVGFSIAAALVVVTVAVRRGDDGVDTPECPSIPRAKRRLEEARATKRADDERAAMVAIARGYLCRHPDADVSALRDVLRSTEPKSSGVQVAAFGAAARFAASSPDLGALSVPPEGRTGSAAVRATDYLFRAQEQADLAVFIPRLHAVAIAVSSDRILVVAMDSPTGSADLAMFEHTGEWRCTGERLFNSVDRLSPSWIDPDQQLAILTSAAAGKSVSHIIDLAGSMPTLAELPDARVHFSWALGQPVAGHVHPAAPFPSRLVEFGLIVTRTPSGIRWDEAIRPDSAPLEAFYELLAGDPAQRLASSGSPEMAAFFGTLSPGDVGETAMPDKLEIKCAVCAGRCFLGYSWADHVFRITSISGPNGCDPLHAPGATPAKPTSSATMPR